MGTCLTRFRTRGSMIPGSFTTPAYPVGGASQDVGIKTGPKNPVFLRLGCGNMSDMRWLVALAVAAVGCGQVDVTIDESKLVEPPPGLEAAVDATRVAFGINDRPKLWFYGPDRERCGGMTFFYEGNCYGGLQGANGILMVIPDGEGTASSTPVVHELAHWKWDDHDHADFATWGGSGSWLDQRGPGYRVGDQYLALVDAGL